MTDTDPAIHRLRAPQRHHAASEASLLDAARRPLLVLVVVVTIVGAVVIATAVAQLRYIQFNFALLTLAVLTVATGRFAIKVAGRSATVSVSEVFLFALLLLFGPAAAVLVIAVDGVWVSCRQRHRRLYRALFNVTEPAISTWMAGQTFFAIAPAPAMTNAHANAALLIPAGIAMAAVFFVLNWALTAAAIAWEDGISVYQLWRRHASYLAINYCAAASLAMLGVANSSGLNLTLVGLLVPLVVLSYVAYKEASTRVDDAQQHVQEVRHLYQATVEMLTITVEGKDRGTHGHVCRVQRHALAVAKALGITDDMELKAIEAGSLLHDIGKIGVPDHILNKPVSLTRAEFDAMKRHTSMGARILTAVDFPYPVVPIVRHHHERWDGRGYPDGLVRSEIPLGARILAVVDCFDALTSDRPYRPRLSDERAIEIVRERCGTFYDPSVVEAFVDLVPQLRRQDGREEDASALLGAVAAGIRQGAGERPRGPRADDGVACEIRRSIRRLIDDHTARIGDAEAALFVINPAGDRLEVAHVTSRLRDSITPLQLFVGHGVSGWVAAHRSTIRNADPHLDFGPVAGQLKLRWCTSTPVFAGGELVGALTVYLTRDEHFSPQEAALVGTLGQEVGMELASAEVDRSERPHLEIVRRSAPTA